MVPKYGYWLGGRRWVPQRDHPGPGAPCQIASTGARKGERELARVVEKLILTTGNLPHKTG